MSDEPKVSLELLQTQMPRVLDEMGSMRDDMRVMTAIVMRMDGTLAGLVEEVRAMHLQYSRMDRRLRDVEEAENRRQ